MAIDEQTWMHDGSDWLSESVKGEPVSAVVSSVNAPQAQELADGGNALTGEQTAWARRASPRVFDVADAEPDPVQPVDGANAAEEPFEADRLAKPDRFAKPDRKDSRLAARVDRADRKAAKKAKARRAKARRRRGSPYRKLRLLPRSVIGISMLVLAAGLGSAVSGTVLYMRYQYRKDVADAYIKGFDKRVQLSTDAVVAEGKNAQARIQAELDPLLKQAATGDTLARLLTEAKDSLVTVKTSDEAGAPVLGTGFVTASDAEKTFLLTSYNVVKAGVVRPGPDITVTAAGTEYKATLWTWQPEVDLALLIINKGGLPRLDWAATADTKLGSQVFALSGLGTDGGAVTSGFVADVSSSGIQHYAPVGTTFQGGPIVNDHGKVVAVASRTYAPLGFGSDGVWFAPLVRSACDVLLKCPQGQVTGAGTQR